MDIIHNLNICTGEIEIPASLIDNNTLKLLSEP